MQPLHVLIWYPSVWLFNVFLFIYEHQKICSHVYAYIYVHVFVCTLARLLHNYKAHLFLIQFDRVSPKVLPTKCFQMNYVLKTSIMLTYILHRRTKLIKLLISNWKYILKSCLMLASFSIQYLNTILNIFNGAGIPVQVLV